MGHRAHVLGVTAALVLASCTSFPVVVPDKAPVWKPTAGVLVSTRDILSAQRRLNFVAFPVLRAASEFCDATKPFFGLSAAPSDSPLVPKGKPPRHAADTSVRVLYAVPGSPADLAGIRPDDVILSVNGVALTSRGSQFLFDVMEDFHDMRLVVQRGTERHLRWISPVEICDIELDLALSTATVAWARHSQVTLSEGMLRFIENEDELAFVISHEVSHVILSHSASSFGRGSATLEREADRTGLYLMARAGYDEGRGADLLLRMADAFPWWDDGTQPSLKSRYDAIASD